MTWVAVGTTAVTAIGGYLSGKSNKKAANAAAAGQREEDAAYQRNIAPYLGLGNEATGQLQNLITNPTAFESDPAYRFLRESSLSALDRSAAARGGLGSGGADADRIALASGLASQEYGNQFNRLYSLAGLGQNAAVGAGNQSSQAAANIGNIRSQQAQNQGDIYSGALGNLGSAFTTYMGNRKPGGAGAASYNNPTSIYNFGNNQDWQTGLGGINTGLGAYGQGFNTGGWNG